MRLQGKVAIVTGAASGIGRAAAILFAKEGAKAVVADVDVEGGTETVSMIREAGGEGAFIRTDVSDTEQVKGMVRFAVETYGKLNVMYNNAGVVGSVGGVVEVSEGDWDRTIAIDLRGVFLCCKHGVPELAKSGGGSIINQSSIGAIVGGGPPGVPTACDYFAAKGGVISLTNTVAYAYGHRGIRANAILPGVIETPPAMPYLSNPAARQALLDQTPIRRMGKPEDVANLALFLASDDSSFISGAAIVIDGAYTLSQGRTNFDANLNLW